MFLSRLEITINTLPKLLELGNCVDAHDRMNRQLLENFSASRVD